MIHCQGAYASLKMEDLGSAVRTWSQLHNQVGKICVLCQARDRGRFLAVVPGGAVRFSLLNSLSSWCRALFSRQIRSGF
jgi:hypothetical protein